MIIDLEQITKENIALYSDFAAADIKEYQSRIYPDKNADAKIWCYINFNGLYIGSVWLEKFVEDDFAVLGIFIADEKYRNKGIGLSAVELMLGRIGELCVDKVLLRVREENKRAIKCYQKAGFVEIRRYEKNNAIKTIEMMYEQSKDQPLQS